MRFRLSPSSHICMNNKIDPGSTKKKASCVRDINARLPPKKNMSFAQNIFNSIDFFTIDLVN